MRNKKILNWYWSGGGAAYPTFWQHGIYYSELSSNSGNDLPEVVNQGADTAIAYTGGKANFNGSTSKISIANGSAYNDSTTFNNPAGTADTAFSFSTWINISNLASNRIIYKKNNEYQAGVVLTSGKINVAFFNGGASSIYLLAQTDVGLTAGVETMVTITYDGSGTFAGIKVYFGETPVSLTNFGSGTYVKMSPTPNALEFGAGSGWTNFLGTMKKITLLKGYVLTQDDVSTLYNNGSGHTFAYDNSVLPYYFLHTQIIATRGNYVLAYDYATNSKLWWSSDRGKTWDRSYAWGSMFSSNLPVHDKWISFSHIFADGTVIFATAKTMWRSTDGLQTVTNPSIKGRGYDWSGNDSDDFVFHTPVFASLPGTYFMYGGNTQSSWEEISGQEVLIWTNYGNVNSYQLGAVPTLVWATKDNGATIQAIYCFGQNTSQRDDGTGDGGPTGTLLGNPSNTAVCRHGHQTARRPGTNDWYVVTGDNSGDIQWVKITYDFSTGLASSAVTLILGNSSADRYFGVGLNFMDQETLRWSTDVAFGGDANEMGIWENDPDNISGKTGETRIKDLGNKTLYGMIIQNGKAFVYGDGGDLNTGFAVVGDSGAGDVTYITVPDKLSQSDLLNRVWQKDAKNFVKVNNNGHDKPGKKTVMYKM